MKVRWQVYDGYVSGSRPQITVVPDDELEDCDTEEEKQRLIEECIQMDFEQYISWVII